jgi:hypothetical protein
VSATLSGSGDNGSAIVGRGEVDIVAAAAAAAERMGWTILIKAGVWWTTVVVEGVNDAAVVVTGSACHKSRLAALPRDVGVRSPPIG